MYAQLIDDVIGITLASASDIWLTDKMTKLERAKKVGEKLAVSAKDKKITTVVFDRGGFSYRGRVQALADGATISWSCFLSLFKIYDNKGN